MQMSSRSTLGKGSRRPPQGPAVGPGASALDPRGMPGAASTADAHPTSLYPPSLPSAPPARARGALEIPASELRVVREAAMVRRGLGRVRMTDAASPQIVWPAGSLGR